MTKVYTEPELNVKWYRINDNIFTNSGGLQDDDEFEMNSDNGAKTNNWFDD